MLRARIPSLLCLSVLLVAGCAPDHRPAVVAEGVRQALRDAPARSVRIAVGLRASEGEREDLVGDTRSIAEATDAIRDLLEGSGASVTETFSEIPGIRIDLPSSEALELLAEHPNVDVIDLDQGGGANLDQSREWVGVEQLYREDVVGVREDGRRVKVAVIDTGINRAHLSFSNGFGGSRIVDRACFCSTDRVGDKCCPDDPNPTDTVPGRFVEDDSGHGTHVAGIVGSNGAGSPRGIAPGVDLVIVRAMNDSTFDSLSDVIRALNWIADKHPDVAAVNMSLGTWSTYVGACDTANATNLDLRDSVERIRRNGGIVTVSTGNNGVQGLQSPACLSNTIAVGNAETLASGPPVPNWSSNGGVGLDLFAPGSNVVSAYVGELDAKGAPIGSTAKYATGVLTGTSMAAPHVAGAVALVRQVHPTVPASAIERCLRAETGLMIEQYGLSRPMLDVPATIACVGSANAGAACIGEELSPGARLGAEQSLCNGKYRFGLDASGDLVLRRGEDVRWRADIRGGRTFVMQRDGNLVVYDASNASRWSSGTRGNDGAVLALEDDGNAVVHRDDGVLWETGSDACVGSRLPARASLVPGQRLCSPSGAYQLGLSATGDLTLSRAGRPLWRAGSRGGVVLINQGDGNLVVRDAGGSSRWSARTYGNPGAELSVGNDGNVSIRTQAGVLWQTGVVDACVGERLGKDARLKPGQFLCADAGAYRFGFDLDGDLVLLGQSQLLWRADIVGSAALIMQGDGNLVARDAAGSTLWKTRTYGPGATLEARPDGSVVVQLAGRELWRTPR